MSLQNKVNNILRQVENSASQVGQPIERIQVSFGHLATAETMNDFRANFEQASVGTAAENAELKMAQSISPDPFYEDIFLDDITYKEKESSYLSHFKFW